MPDDLEVVARIRARNATGRGARAAERRLSRVGAHADTVGMQIGGALTRGLSVLAGGYVMGRITSGIIGIQTEIQEAQYGLASLFNVTYSTPMTDALKQARTEIQGLKTDAAQGVGELQHYLGAYQMLLGPAAAAGATKDQIRELTRQSLSAGFAMRGQEGLVLGPMDVVQALTGGVRERQTPYAMAALRASGMDPKAFNKLSTPEKLKELTKAFGAFEAGVELMGRSWSAQMGTFRDHIKDVLRSVTAPIFDKWSDQLRVANDWLGKNRSTMADMAERTGPRLVAVWENLVENAAAYAGLVGAAGFVGMGGPGMASGAYRGGRGAYGQVAGAAAWGASLPGRKGFFGKMAGGGAAALGEIGVILRPLVAVFSKLAGPIGIVVVAFQAVVGAFQEFPTVVFFITTWWAILMESFAQLGGAFGMLTGEGSALNLVGGALGLAFGGLLMIFTVIVKVIATVVAALGMFVQVIGRLAKALFFVVTGQFGKAGDEVAGIGATSGSDFIDKVHGIWTSWGVDGAGGGYDPLVVPDAPGKKPPPQNVNIGKVEIHNNLETNEDPARVAQSFDQLLDRISRYRTQPRRIPTPSAAGGI
jgi:hypothetical protein